jgi:hypothetical protein
MTNAERAEAVEVMAKSNPLTRYMRTSQIQCGDAPFIMSWPDPLTAEYIRDVEDFFAIWLRQMKRQAALLAAGFVVKKENADG